MSGLFDFPPNWYDFNEMQSKSDKDWIIKNKLSQWYTVESKSDGSTLVTVVAPGYGFDGISVTIGDKLRIEGHTPAFNILSIKPFKIELDISPHAEVESATMLNGILSIKIKSAMAKTSKQILVSPG